MDLSQNWTFDFVSTCLKEQNLNNPFVASFFIPGKPLEPSGNCFCIIFTYFFYTDSHLIWQIQPGTEPQTSQELLNANVTLNCQVTMMVMNQIINWQDMSQRSHFSRFVFVIVIVVVIWTTKTNLRLTWADLAIYKVIFTQTRFL